MPNEHPSVLKLNNQVVKSLALEAGFDACGVAKAERLTEDEAFYKEWLRKSNHGDMFYLERNLDKRLDPQLMVPGCQSIVVVLLNYFPSSIQHPDAPRVAKYAYSNIDYHFVIKEKLTVLEQKIIDKYGESAVANQCQHRFVDSAPVFERRWAQKAGLGWIGKHTQLIHPSLGSYVFIGVLMLNLVTDEYDQPVKDRCGSCTRCLVACPTKALEAGTLDARKCISYLTIESKNEIPEAFHQQLSANIIGCDICADVCPWNKKWARPHSHTTLEPNQHLMKMDDKNWLSIDKATFNTIFKTSAIQRAGFEKISQNLQIYNMQKHQKNR